MSDSVPADTSPTIGQRLAAARERLGHSVVAAADKTRLDPAVIAGLEADRFETLGPPVYVRGHLRMYAEFLELPTAELLADYQQLSSAGARPDLTRIAKAERQTDPRKWLGPVLAALLAVVLAAVAWWVLRKPVAAPAAVDMSAPVVAPDIGVPLEQLNQRATGSEGPGSAAVEPAPAPPDPVVTPAEPSTSGTSNSTANAPRTAPPVAAPARTTELRLSLSADSWVEVYDAGGRRLYHDVATAGSVQSFRGPGPMRIVLGNADAASLAVDGRPIDIPAELRRGKLARLMVNPSGTVTRAR
ncbi:MAG: helix-turn-helix domain-containing protein [Steroidobacteraceae bacterium]